MARRFSPQNEMRTLGLLVTCVICFVAGKSAPMGTRSELLRLNAGKHAEVGTAPVSPPPFSSRPEEKTERLSHLFAACKEPVTLRRRFELFKAIGGLTAGDLPALVDHTAALPFRIHEELLPALIERWFELDPSAAEKWMLLHPKNSAATDAWASANPEGALEAALAAHNSELMRAAIKVLAGSDITAQAARLGALPPSYARDEVLVAVLREWTKTDPKAAYGALKTISSQRLRDTARTNVLQEWASNDPASALAELQILIPTLTAGVLGHDLVNIVAVQAAQKDSGLALEWLMQLPQEFRNVPAIRAAMMWSRTEPIAALEWCMANGIDVGRMNRHDLTQSSAGVLAEAIARFPSRALEWLEQLPAGAERERLLERGLTDTLWRMPKDQLFGADGVAIRLFNNLTGEAQARLALRLGEERGKLADFADVDAFAQNFPSASTARADAVAGAIGSAYSQDASRIDMLLATVTTTADRDAALRGLADAMSRDAPAEAAARALSIENRSIQQEALGSIMALWSRRDPNSSRAWLNDHPAIPAAWKQAWLAPR
jgi:hypothetical protein